LHVPKRQTDIRFKQGRKKGLEEGIEEGQVKAKKAFIEKLLAQGDFTVEQIQDLTGAAVKLINEVKADLLQKQATAAKPLKKPTKNGKKQ
jgi:flagellar biosynthesis/type III secretory pathway protein FliH